MLFLHFFINFKSSSSSTSPIKSSSLLQVLLKIHIDSNLHPEQELPLQSSTSHLVHYKSCPKPELELQSSTSHLADLPIPEESLSGPLVHERAKNGLFLVLLLLCPPNHLQLFFQLLNKSQLSS